MSKALKKRLKLFKKHGKRQISIGQLIMELASNTSFQNPSSLTESQIAIRYLSIDGSYMETDYRRRRTDIEERMQEVKVGLRKASHIIGLPVLSEYEKLHSKLKKLDKRYETYSKRNSEMINIISNF